MQTANKRTPMALRRAPANGAPVATPLVFKSERAHRPMAALPHWRPRSVLGESKSFGYDEKALPRSRQVLPMS
jgi:hypothetical protein